MSSKVNSIVDTFMSQGLNNLLIKERHALFMSILLGIRKNFSFVPGTSTFGGRIVEIT